MKILFISSGYKGIYKYFEDWILHELKKKHEVQHFQIKDGLHMLQSFIIAGKPDIALTLVGFKIPIKMTHLLKKWEVKTAIWFTEDPYFIDKTNVLSNYYDFVFTIDTAALEYYKKNGHKHAYHLPLATDLRVFQPKQVEAHYRSDICLVGYPYPERVQYIQHLLQHTDYKIKVVGTWKNSLSRFRNNRNLVIHEGWVEPSIVADFYNGANIVLNTHRPFNLKNNQNRLGIAGKSINNRTFDAAACDSFQLIEFKEDLPNHFIEDEEMVAFRNYEELIQKIDHYMEFEEVRQKIANNARSRVLREHTFQHRLDKMLSIICNSP
ncbi:CgeB family protein [Bacillus sp. FSL K6-3431]|uniref:CgeB family protein n=1 Tax=Bacillus sp. FSL K6-3431 TaxID=2921500 RepID=UPI0030F876ED